MELNKDEQETTLQYIWRLASAKDAGVIELTWDELTDVLNKNLNESACSSTYRKPYQCAKSYYDDVFSKMESESINKELMEQKRELARLKVQYRDERTAWNKQNYTDARIEQKLDYLEEQLSQIGNVCFKDYSSVYKDIPNSDNDLIISLSDLHIGETFNSSFGQYDSKIAIQRLDKYLLEVVKIARRHNSENAHVVLLGDQISGSIHLSIQVSNRENVIEQIKLSSELISNFCIELSKYFKNVYVYSVDGNHSRLVSNKEMAVKDERLDSLITWIVQQITKFVDNIHVQTKNLDSSIARFVVRDNVYLAVHGDCDSMTQSGVGKLCMSVGEMPYAILGGHRHVPAYEEFNGVKYIQSGSLAGAGDDFTVSKRLSGKASQTVLVCNSIGIECIYNTNLD